MFADDGNNSKREKFIKFGYSLPRRSGIVFYFLQRGGAKFFEMLEILDFFSYVSAGL